MATIAENLKTIKDSTEAIKSAILEKGGTIEGNLTTYASAIANLPSGGGDVNPTATKNAVTFYDYDGTIRYSYTAEEFLALTEMPPLPTQKGLICQEWNWSFEDAIEYVAEYGVLDVGATYITDDGKTRLYIRIAAEGRMDVPLYFQQTIANGVIIDWGDGTATETLDGTGKVNTTHRYASIGDYMISLDVAEGCTLTLGHNTNGYCVMGSTGSNKKVYCGMLQKVEIGRRTSINSQSAFGYCYSLKSITMPNSITITGIYVFQSCYSLRCIIFPSNTTLIYNAVATVCYSLKKFICNKTTTFGTYVFNSCTSLSSFIIPPNITNLTNYLFGNNVNLISIIIPASVTSVQDQTFCNCYGMAYYDFSHHTSIPTLANTNAFTGIPDDCKIIVPDNLYDTWIAATNWSTYASYIIKKTDWNKLQQ